MTCLDELPIRLDVLMPMIGLGLIFILVATGAYKKSYSTTIYVIAIAIAAEFSAAGNSNMAILIITIGAFLSLGRAIVNHEQDQWVKR